MTDVKLYKVMDLIEEINEVDKMILLHKRKSSSKIMFSQYQAKKIKLTGHLINELNAPGLKSSIGFIMLKRLLNKFYADSSSLSENNHKDLSDLKKLEAFL